MEETIYLSMKFRDETGRLRSINIPDPLDTLSGTEVETVMQTIIDKDIFDYGLVSADSAIIITRIEEEVY